MQIRNEDLLDIDGTRATVSLAASANLKPIYVGGTALASIQLVFTGTPAGNFKLQLSNDLGRPNSASGEATKYVGVSNWSDMANSSLTVSAAGDIWYDLPDISAEWIRVVWTATGAGSGTPTLTIARSKSKG